jgi:hypothetical protein
LDFIGVVLILLETQRGQRLPPANRTSHQQDNARELMNEREPEPKPEESPEWITAIPFGSIFWNGGVRGGKYEILNRLTARTKARSFTEKSAVR